MVSVAAERVADPETKAGLVAVARAVEQHIEAGVSMETAEISARCAALPRCLRPISLHLQVLQTWVLWTRD
jgi:hypothetical protein